MKVLDLIGYKRKDLSKASTRKLRLEGYAPCVLYGHGSDNIHFYVPLVLFKTLVYTSKIHFINMDVEGSEYTCIFQDIQFHPVSENILHADFLILQNDRPIRMEVPINFIGQSAGILKGGKLLSKLRTISVRTLPQNMPEQIDVSIDGLDLGQSVKISKLKVENYTILNNPQVTIATILIPRSLRSAASKTETESEETI